MQSDGHCIYWPDSLKVSIRRNLLFHGESKLSEAPLISTETNRLSMSTKIKKVQMLPSVALVPITSNVLNEEIKIQRNIKISSEDKLEELQPCYLVPSGLKEVEPPRRSKRIWLKKEQLTSQGLVTRPQARNQPGNQLTSLAFEDLEIIPIGLSEHNSTHLNINIIDDYFAISVVLISDEKIYSMTIDQNMAEPSNIDEALNDPLWKRLMDDKYKALIDKQMWEVVISPKNVNIVGNKWVFI